MNDHPDEQALEQLKALWADIDEVDQSLLALLESRLEIYREIGQLTRDYELKIDHQQRETEVLEHLIDLSQDNALRSSLPRVYQELSSICISTLSDPSIEDGSSQDLSTIEDWDLTPVQTADLPKKTKRRPMTKLIRRQLGRFKWRPKGQKGAERTAPLTAQQRTWLTTSGFAHRGLHNAHAGIAENSLPSFEEAISHGYGIELDVHLSSDGIPVVFHDEDLARMTGAKGVVNDQSLAELKELRLIPSDAKIPTLREALDLIDGRAPVLVEIKNHAKPVGPLESAIYNDIQEYQGPLCVQSFNPMSLSWFLKRDPKILRGLIAYSFPVEEVPLRATTRFLLKNLLFTPLCKPHYIAYRHEDIIRHRLRRLHRLRARGTPILAWTILSQSEASLALHRVDNVIFEGFNFSRPERVAHLDAQRLIETEGLREDDLEESDIVHTSEESLAPLMMSIDKSFSEQGVHQDLSHEENRDVSKALLYHVDSGFLRELRQELKQELKQELTHSLKKTIKKVKND